MQVSPAAPYPRVMTEESDENGATTKESVAEEIVVHDDQSKTAVPPLAARRLAAMEKAAEPAAEILRQITDQTASYRAISEHIDQAARPLADFRLNTGDSLPEFALRNLVSKDPRTPQIDDLASPRRPLSAMQGYAEWQQELTEQREELARGDAEAEAGLEEYARQRAALEAERHEQMLAAMHRSAHHTRQLLEEHRHSRGLQVGTFVVAFLGLLGGVLVPAWPGLSPLWRVVLPVVGGLICASIVWLLVVRKQP